MKLIAHRGNLFGPNPDLENSPKYLLNAANQGFDVEVDLWVKDNKLFFGHDGPLYRITPRTLARLSYHAWIHCKNVEALEWCKEQDFWDSLHYFWHQKDSYTLTSRGYIWTYPGKTVPKGGVLVDKNLKVVPKDIEYVCSDWVGKIKPEEEV